MNGWAFADMFLGPLLYTPPAIAIYVVAGKIVKAVRGR